MFLTGSPECQPGYDFYSRVFAPWCGIPEDPVTGRKKSALFVYMFVCFNSRKIWNSYDKPDVLEQVKSL